MSKLPRYVTPTIPIKVNAPYAAGPAGVSFGGGFTGSPSIWFGPPQELPPLGIVVPPGGFAGFAQQTPATQALFARAGRRGGMTTQRRRRRKGKTKSAAKRKRRSGTRRGKARLVKGSAAAKRYMAKIRRKRKR